MTNTVLAQLTYPVQTAEATLREDGEVKFTPPPHANLFVANLYKPLLMPFKASKHKLPLQNQKNG